MLSGAGDDDDDEEEEYQNEQYLYYLWMMTKLIQLTRPFVYFYEFQVFDFAFVFFSSLRQAHTIYSFVVCAVVFASQSPGAKTMYGRTY